MSFQHLADLCRQSCERFAEEPVFGEKRGDGEWVWMSYAELGTRVAETRAALARLGVGRGDRVALISDNRSEWAIVAYAVYGLGAVLVPMYQAQRPDEWVFILDDCGAKMAICATAEIVRVLGEHRTGLPALEHLLAFDVDADHPAALALRVHKAKEHPIAMASPEPDELAALIYTSGTTGKPKGVMLTHHNLCSNVLAVADLFPIGPADRSLSFLPWAHAFGQTGELHVLLHVGASLAINDEIPQLIDNLAVIQPTILFAVPRIFNRIYDRVMEQIGSQPAPIRALVEAGLDAAKRSADGEDLGLVARAARALADRLVFRKVRARFGGRLRYAISGSAALSPEVGAFIDALGIEVYEGYGLTETSPIATVNVPGHRKMGSVGRAIPGVRIEIDRSVTGPDDDGEIIIHGPNVMKGYYKREDEQAAAFTPDGGLHSGDTGYLDDDGYLFIRGRLKDQYKLENGKFVMPAPLEETLSLSPYIANALLEGANRPYTVAVVVPDPEKLAEWSRDTGNDVSAPERSTAVHELMSREVEKQARDFKGYERPRKVLVLGDEMTTENGMLTPTLKLKRKKVIDRYRSEIDALYE